MTDKTYYFLTGMPRSGSTVLASILNQNPAVYVTPTSPLLDQLIINQNIWNDLQSVKANPIPVQLTNITRRLIHAMYAHRNESIIIDKNRGWSKNMPASSILFEKDIKALVLVRDLPSIIASWISLFMSNKKTYMHKLLLEKGLSFTPENIANEIWTNMVKDCMEGICEIRQTANDRCLFIHYDDLINAPETTLEEISSFLSLPVFKYDTNNIVSDNIDNDFVAWGINNMHKIRPVLEKTSTDPNTVLGDKLYNHYSAIEKNYT